MRAFLRDVRTFAIGLAILAALAGIIVLFYYLDHVRFVKCYP